MLRPIAILLSSDGDLDEEPEPQRPPARRAKRKAA
jgi:hypothetical protein